MPEAPTRLGVLLHEARTAAQELADDLVATASSRGMKVVFLEEDAPPEEPVDLIVGIGGDGTLLRAAGIAHPRDLPVIGINLGTVGYLAEVDPAEITLMVDALAAGEFSESHRMTLAAVTATGRWSGLNDVVVEKALTQRLVELTVEIDGERFTTYRADGVIVATPLGSTAYSLSAGGPVVDPKLDALILTPVAPHSLLSRSLVLSPTAAVRLTTGTERNVLLNVDGRAAAELGPGDTVTVTRGDTPARFLSFAGAEPFPQGVRRQFGLDHA